MTGHVFIVVVFLSIDVMLLAVILALTIARVRKLEIRAEKEKRSQP